MPAHQRVCAWVAQNYQKPAIDQEWLADCSDWISSELGLDPVRDFDQFVEHVETQLLQSNLADSTVSGSGIDPLLVASDPRPARPRPSNRRLAHRPSRQKKTTGATPLLVEIKSITEIAYSAFNLLNTHQTRLDRADLGLAQENVEQHGDEDEGPVPRFPRGMLRFELSDGLTTFRAIEFRSLPQLELGATPLGYKMLLKSTPIRNGIAFLEPSNVTLKGYRTEDHDVNGEQVFLSLLRKRLGRPDPLPEAPVIAQPSGSTPERASARQHKPPPSNLDDMYPDEDVDPDVLREMTIQMDEAIDMQENRRPSNRAPPPVKPLSASKEQATICSDPKQTSHLNTVVASSSLKATSASLAKISPYFTAHSSESKLIPDIGLTPRPAPVPEPDFDITWDIDDPDSGPSGLPNMKIGSSSARPLPAAPIKHVPKVSSPDLYDDLSFDMDVDDSFLEQVGMIEQGALCAGTDSKGKGKGKDTGTEGRPNVVPSKKASSGSAVGTNCLAVCPVSPSGAEPSTRTQSNTKRATSASSLSGSTESAMPRSTQSSDRRLPRDPSLIIISSESEDDAPKCRNSIRPITIAQGHARKGGKMDQDEPSTGSDVIDISD